MSYRLAHRAHLIESASMLFFRRFTSGIARPAFARTSRGGLAAHIQGSQQKKRGLLRWIVFSVAAGAFVAVMIVTFLAR
jgi:hypothetical protein